MKNKGGRPKIIDKIVLQKLEEAFSNDATDIEACFIAEIGTSTLYDYQKENPKFSERKVALKGMTSYQAKANITKAIKENDKIDDSKWYAERKLKNEGFNSRTELTGKDGDPIAVTGFNYIKPNEDNNTDDPAIA